MMNLNEQVIVVIGGNGLLGKEFIKAIEVNNAIVINADIDNTKINKNTKYVDITSKESINRLILDIDIEYKKIDAIINAAYPRNKNYGRSFFDVEYEDFCENTNLHLGGYFLASQQFAQYFKKQGYGNIINIASVYGVIPPKFEIYGNSNMTMPVEYAAIKSSLIHLTKYMAKYLKNCNIRVNSISPGGILDNQNSNFLIKYKEECLSKGMLDKTDINGTLLFLLSDNSKYINGQNIIIDDGFVL